MNQASSKQTIWFVTCVKKKKTRTRFSGCANKHTVCCLGKKNQLTMIVLGWGSSDKKKRKEVYFFALLK